MARFVSGNSRVSHVTPTLKSLHWLPVKQESSSKPWYSYISTSPLASQSTLTHICLYVHLLLKQDVAIQKKMFLKVPFYSSVHKSKVHFNKFSSCDDAPNSSMICHWKFKMLLHFYVSKGNLKLTCFRSLSHCRFFNYQMPMVPLVST